MFPFRFFAFNHILFDTRSISNIRNDDPCMQRECEVFENTAEDEGEATLLMTSRILVHNKQREEGAMEVGNDSVKLNLSITSITEC